jgi:hypothetical protein
MHFFRTLPTEEETMGIITKRTSPPHADDRLAAWYAQKSTYLQASDRFSSPSGTGGGSGESSQTPPVPPRISPLRVAFAMIGWLIPLIVGLAILALIHTFIS